MRIGISGYGRMGELIREKALAKGHTVPVVIDPVSQSDTVTHRSAREDLGAVDVIIDFSIPKAVVENVAACAEKGIPVVVGTTGWYESMEDVRKFAEAAGIGCIWSGNFSLGVNLFFHMVRAAGRVMNRFSQYDCMVHEYHHKKKADSPSGTADMIGRILLEELDRKSSVTSDSLDRAIREDELHVSSTRGGSIPGIHRVTFDSDVDTISLEHSARTRSGFAEGAVLAAEWIVGKSDFYTIDDMMKTIIEGE